MLHQFYVTWTLYPIPSNTWRNYLSNSEKLLLNQEFGQFWRLEGGMPSILHSPKLSSRYLIIIFSEKILKFQREENDDAKYFLF